MMQSYQLDLPEALKNIYDVFYVSLVEPYLTVKGRKLDQPPFIEVDAEDQTMMREVLDSKMHYGKLIYLIKWLGYSVTDNEWIEASDIVEANEYIAEFHSKYPRKPSSENQQSRETASMSQGLSLIFHYTTNFYHLLRL